MARPIHCQEFYQIAIERDEKTIAAGGSTPEILSRLAIYRTELRWWLTGTRVEKKNRRARASDEIIHSPEQTAAFHSFCMTFGDHVIFQSPSGRHIHVASIIGPALISARRFAYALAFPDDPFTSEDDIMVTCDCLGEANTGNGLCVAPEHLKKVPAYAATTLRAAGMPSARFARERVVPGPRPDPSSYVNVSA